MIYLVPPTLISPLDHEPLLSAQALLKRARWQARRGRAASRWGAEALASSPIVFGNAMPKSGSHLINQVITGLPQVGPFVKSGYPPVNRFEDNSNLSEAQIVANLQQLQPGDIAYGYLRAQQPFLDLLSQPGFATIFIYRDPRDVVVSQVFYASEMYREHGMHDYYTRELSTTAERIAAAIQGVDRPGLHLRSIASRYHVYSGWLEQPQVLSIRFEQLIQQQEIALNAILDFLAGRGFTPIAPRSQVVVALASAVSPQRSGTFRKGRPGNWREHFTSENKRLMKDVTGDLLVRLGYEKDMDW
ncbi:MAG: sulfotransferase domain-containing protein [Anaerolineae bacterium]|nr:sulfotransferase domain-containing protein [Anaerolineae bacterium]